MVRFASITAALAAGLLPQLAQAGLNTAAKAKGLTYFGTATDNPELTDTAYVTQLNNTDDFGQLTPGNSQKWDATEPSQNTFSFEKGDAIVSMAEANGQKMRCHNLVWYSQLPSWVTSGSWTNETLLAVMKNHITKVVTHYKGRCLAWDVVNEALNDDGSYRDNVFYEHIGEAYIPIAFATAAAADPDAKLYYNDYSIEWASDKATAAQNIVKLVKSYGAKIDGVGLQAHFTIGQTPAKADLASTLKSFTALDVEVAYTEMDVRMELPKTDAKLAQQSTDFANLVGACVETSGCVGVTIWDWTDKYSWVPSTFSGYGAACPWNDELEKKPAYSGILKALGGSASATSSSASRKSTLPAASPYSLPVSSASSSSSSSSTISPSTISSFTTVQSAASTNVAQRWGQCGGNGWTGPTACVSECTCTKQNDWYYQCL